MLLSRAPSSLPPAPSEGIHPGAAPQPRRPGTWDLGRPWLSGRAVGSGKPAVPSRAGGEGAPGRREGVRVAPARGTDGHGESPPKLWDPCAGGGGADAQEDAAMGPGENHQPQTTHLCFSPRFPESGRGTPHGRRLAPPRPPPAPAPSPAGGLRLPSGFRDRHVTSMKRGGGAAGSRGRGGIWDPEVRPQRRKRGGMGAGGGGQTRGREGPRRGRGWGSPGGAQKPLERGEREARGAGRSGGRQVPAGMRGAGERR